MPKQNQTKQTNTRGQQTSQRFAICTAHPVKKKELTCIFQFLVQTTQAQLTCVCHQCSHYRNLCLMLQRDNSQLLKQIRLVIDISLKSDLKKKKPFKIITVFQF